MMKRDLVKNATFPENATFIADIQQENSRSLPTNARMTRTRPIHVRLRGGTLTQ